MISLEELNSKKYELTDEQKLNQVKLHKAINLIRTAYNKPMTVSSGVRSMEHHLNVYKQINEDRAKKKLDPVHIPMSSRHLIGAAVDIADPKGELSKWCKDNTKILEDAGLWCEAFEYTKGWCHFQIIPPKSGKRFFTP